MKIDLRTISTKVKIPVKSQPAWAEAAFDLFVSRNGTNMQMQIGAEFPHSSGWLRGKEAIDRIETTWLAIEPILKQLGVCGKSKPISNGI